MRPIILTLFLLAQFTFAAGPEIKGTSAELTAYLSGIPKLVSITGESEVKAIADRAKVTLKISTESKSLVESLRLNQEARGRVVSLLKESGIGPDQVQAARFSSTQKYGIFSEKAKSHRVENFLKITVRDEKEFQAVASTVDRLAEVHFLGIDFEHSNKEKLKAQAQAQACDNAGERRKMFEDKLGVKLSAKRFSEVSVVPVNPDRKYYDHGYASFSKGEMTTRLYGRSPDEGAAEESGSPFGELIFAARVTVEYAVESN